jgi:hypothetical protein
MKTLTRLSLLLVVLSLIFSCSKDNSLPGSDVNGFWIGQWISPQADSGTFISVVKQSSTSLDGHAMIRLFSDENTNYAASYDASLKENKFNSVLEMSSVNVYVQGLVADSGATVEGSFSVPYLKMKGNFNGHKIPSYFPEMKEIYTYQGTSPGESITDALCVNNELWIFTYPYEWVDTQAVSKVIVTDLDGKFLRYKYFPYEATTYTYDGQYIWGVYNGSTLYRFDTSGNDIHKFNLKVGSFNVCGDGQSLYFNYSLFKVLQTDYSLNPIDTIDLRFISSFRLAFYGNNLFITESGNVLKFNKSGKILAGYSFPELTYIDKLIYNEDRIWGYATIYDSKNPGNPPTFKLYELEINP